MSSRHDGHAHRVDQRAGERLDRLVVAPATDALVDAFPALDDLRATVMEGLVEFIRSGGPDLEWAGPGHSVTRSRAGSVCRARTAATAATALATTNIPTTVTSTHHGGTTTSSGAPMRWA
jgi:hypothetical protein